MQKEMRALVQKLKRREFLVKLLFGYTPSQKQRELLNLEGEILTICAGRRFGKTSYVAARIFHDALLNPDWKIVVAGPSHDQATIYFDILTTALETSPLRGFVKEIKVSPFPTIVLKNKSEITVRSTAYDGRYLRGRKVNEVVLTEAAFVKDGIFEKVILPMRLDTKARIILESTPNGHNYFFEQFTKGLKKDGFHVSFHATVYDNPAIDPTEIEHAKNSVPDYVWRQEYLAEFIDDDAAFFPWRVLQDVFEDYTPTGFKEGRRYSIGVDLAKYQDYTVIVVLDVTEEPYKLAEFCRLNRVLYEDAINTINEIQAKYNAPVYLDATGVGDPVSERVRACVPFVFTQKTKSELLHNLLLALEQKKILLPTSNTVLRDELRFFRRVKSGSGVKLEAQTGYHDDCVMALALALRGATSVSIIEAGKQTHKGWW